MEAYKRGADWLASHSAQIRRIRRADKADKKDGEAVYFIRDCSVGFDMRYVDKLFEPFQR